MTRDYKKQSQWKRENNVYIGLGLSKKTDADIIEYIEDKTAEGETKQGVIKRSLRSTMEAEGYKPDKGGEDEKETGGRDADCGYSSC